MLPAQLIIHTGCNNHPWYDRAACVPVAVGLVISLWFLYGFVYIGWEPVVQFDATLQRAMNAPSERKAPKEVMWLGEASFSRGTATYTRFLANDNSCPSLIGGLHPRRLSYFGRSWSISTACMSFVLAKKNRA